MCLLNLLRNVGIVLIDTRKRPVSVEYSPPITNNTTVLTCADS